MAEACTLWNTISGAVGSAARSVRSNRRSWSGER
jgi:hypothetical protein